MRRWLWVLILCVFIASPAYAGPSFSGGGGGTSSEVTVDASGFTGNLGVADTDLQTALETIDAVALGGDTTESNQDDAWAALTGTETGIDVTYQDATDDVDFVIDVTPSSGSATLEISEDAVQVKYDSTDFKESTNGLYLGDAPTIATSLAIGTDPADAGAIRLPNAGYIYSEADAAGTDISVIGVDSGELVQIAASGSSGVVITPATTITGVLTTGSTIELGHANDTTIARDSAGVISVQGAVVSLLGATIGASEVDADVATQAEIDLKAPLASPTLTGIVTFPIAATPTTDADGEMSFDTDGWGTGYDALEIWNGTASAYVVATTAADTPTDGQVPKWNTGGTITWEADDDSGGTPTVITVADSTDTTSFIGFFETATGDVAPKTDASNLTYNATTGALTAASFVGTTDIETALGAAYDTSGELDALFNAKAPLASPTFTGTLTVPVGLTGVLRADTGVMSVDTDVTDLVVDGDDDGATKGVVALDNDDFNATTGVVTLATTATAAELNYLDITTLGTGVASKAVVLSGTGGYTAPAGTWDLSGVTAITLRGGEIVLADLAAGVYAKDIVTTGPVTGAADNVLVGADSDVTLALDFTATWDFGGATALEIPNGTASPASTTGSIALDTDGDGAEFDGPMVVVSTSGATMGYIMTTAGLPGTAEDNYVIKYDAVTDLVSWEADDTGSALGGNLASTTNDITTDNNTIQLVGNSEDLDFDFVTNGLNLTSDTGLLLVDFGTINLAAGAFDASDGNISNVGQLDVDTIIADGAALALGDGSETIAVDSSAWNISTTGDVTGVTIELAVGGETITNAVDDVVVIASNDEEKIAFDLSTATDNEILITGADSGVTQLDIQIATLKMDGLDVDGVIALGDGGDNFVVASDGIDIDASGNITNAGTIGSGAITSTGAVQGTSLVASAGDASLTDATPQIAFTDSTHSSGGLIKLDSTDADDTKMVLSVDDSGGDDQGYIELDGVAETVDILQALTGSDATFTGTTTISSLVQSAVAAPTWTTNDSTASADGTFDIRVNAATAKYAGVMNIYVEEGDGAGGDGSETEELFMTINGSGAQSTSSGTIEFERIGNFEMGLSSSAGTASGGFIDLYEDEDDGSNKVRIIAPAMASNYTITLPTSGGTDGYVLKTDGSGTTSWTTAGSATAWDDITDPDNNTRKTITFDNAAEATTLSSAYDTAGSFFVIDNTDADHANNTYLLDLDYSADDGDVDADYIKAQDSGGVVFTLQQDGDMATTGSLTLDSDSVVISLGDDQDVTITHNPDNGLIYKSTATGDNNPYFILIQTGETDIAADDALGVINFQAPDEATGTDANLIAAAIAAVSEGDFSASSNATKLSFLTGASEAASEKMALSSAGVLTIASDLTVTGGDITLGTTSIFSGGDTASLNNIDSIDATTESTIETAIDTLSNVTTVGALASGSLAAGFTDVPVAQGGTGVSTLADGGLVIGNAAGVVEVVAAGATTEILVGGGASTAPVWTTAQGTGAPVRAGSPTLTTPNIGAATGTSLDISGAAGLVLENDETITNTVDGTVVISGALTVQGTLATTGAIRGLTDVTVTTAATLVLDAAAVKNTLHQNGDSDAIDYTLPAATAGLTACFMAGEFTGVITIDPVDGTDTIYLDGASIGAGDVLQSPGTAGDFVCLIAIDSTKWYTMGKVNTWVDGGDV